MRNRLCSLGVLAVCLCLSEAGWGLAQKPKKSGEINTPPARGERHKDTVKTGDPAPDFTLPLLQNKGEVALSSFKGKKPVVLIFGSFT